METYCEQPFEMKLMQSCIAMKGCKEWLVLLMSDGELRAWHRIDKYWDNDIEPIGRRESMINSQMHSDEGILQVV